MEETVNEKIGLGDFVEMVIEKTVPKLAKRAKEKGCKCNERKVMLNNIGAIFST